MNNNNKLNELLVKYRHICHFLSIYIICMHFHSAYDIHKEKLQL